jgi:Tol biopolymer transport system component
VYGHPRLSPDGHAVIVPVADPVAATSDLWLIDVERDIEMRFTSGARSAIAGVWSPDGDRIVYSMPRGAPPFMHVQRVDGGEPAAIRPAPGTNQWAWDWAKDGVLVFGDRSPETNWDIWTLRMDGGEPEVFLRTRYRERDARVSPDGRRVAYVSDESGSFEVYVRTFPNADQKRRVSTNGGEMPAWGGGGSELFFVDADDNLMAVSLSPGDGIEPGAPTVLFEQPGILGYDVTADGQRFLVNIAESEEPSRAVVLLDWVYTVGHRR